MNNRLSLEFGQTYTRIPLTTSPHVLCADALETDWAALLPPEDCSYVFGNPPFVGAKFQTGAQRLQVRRIADLGKSGGTLDYVTAWFIRAGEYLRKSATRIGFVATNSITQGEQAAQLWPLLFERCRLEISPSPTAPSPGGRTRAGWRTCTSSSSGWTPGRRRGRKSACSAIPT